MTTTLLHGDCRELLKTLPDRSVQCCVTSPPYYGLRDYGVDGQIGLEQTPAAYVAALVDVFREVRRVLRDDGVLWLNLGDSYAAHGRMVHDIEPSKSHLKPHKNGPSIGRVEGFGRKQLIGIPWRVAFALQDDGWYLRSDIIWHKPNPMPESVTDRPTKAHEYLFLLAKSERYYYDAAAIAEPSSGTNERTQQRRAKELAQQHGLTDEHIAAIRAAGATDAGKAMITQSGTGKNTARIIELAAYAKEKLGGYYREFLLSETRNRRTVWTIATRPYADAHFATFPEALVEPCIMAGSAAGDTVLDPFMGSGTVARVAERLQRHAIGCELNAEYIDLQEKRTDKVQVEMFV